MTNLWAFLLQTLYVAGVGLLLLAIKTLLKDKLSPRWQYAVWAVLALRILLPAYTGKYYVLLPLPLWVETAKVMVEPHWASAYTNVYEATQVTSPIPWLTGAPVSLSDWLFLLYVVGVVVTLLWYLISWLRLCLLLRQGTPVPADVQEQIERIGKTYACKTCRAIELTGLENPKSREQMLTWLQGHGVAIPDLRSATVEDALEHKNEFEPDVARVLELRQQLGKTSVTKYEAMQSAVCADGRVRGLLQYYGAGRTGRWAGRLVQVQNLPQNHLAGLGLVRELVRERDLETLELCFDSVPDVLSQLIRTAFVAGEGNIFHVADYSAIEARVIAYLAGEKWRMDVFRSGGDIYCSSASAMFRVPVVKHGVNGHLRQKGKIAELACGYGGGVGALRAFGADKMGLTEEEMQDIVTQWRAASPAIPRFWRDAESAAVRAINNPGRTTTVPCGVKDRRDGDALRCRLPSGRILSYWDAKLDTDGSICFMGQNQTTRRWEKTSTWGGKLVENIVQAYARDCLAVAMVRLAEEGWKICFHVHDEVIVEAPIGTSWEQVAEVMGRPIDWAPGLLLRGDGYSTPFYRKD